MDGHEHPQSAADAVIADIARRIPPAQGALVYGICGAQGSGKSTIAAAALAHFNAIGLSAGVLSLDDLYFSREERRAIAARTHPLFITRGPPGTHNTRLGVETLAAAKRGDEVQLPRYSKARDARIESAAPARYNLIIFEGWCVGAAAEDDAALTEPVNTLERVYDADARWRRLVNQHLAREYRQMFALIDRCALLVAPSFGIVRAWRTEQERKLAATLKEATADDPKPGLLSDDEIAFFIQHYERVTRAMMARRSAFDLVIDLDERRAATGVDAR